MAAIKTAAQLAERAIDVAQNYRTLYVMGCIGAPMTEMNKAKYIAHHSYNRDADRKAMINACNADTFGFDCVCLIKALLWGWCGKKSKSYGGAVYGSNKVPDINADAMIRACKEISTDFSKIEVGEAVWVPGHIGIYVGNGLVVECTPNWDNCVQITACNRAKSGYHRRNWTKHGKLPYVSYSGQAEASKPQTTTGTKKPTETIAREVIAGKWGSGAVRKQRLAAAGYDYAEVQALVNKLMKQPAKKTDSDIAREVINGKWGTNPSRALRLLAAGYNPKTIQQMVNKLLK